MKRVHQNIHFIPNFDYESLFAGVLRIFKTTKDRNNMCKGGAHNYPANYSNEKFNFKFVFRGSNFLCVDSFHVNFVQIFKI